MNKFLQKVAKILLGLSMAAGVGVAVANRHEVSETRATDFTISSASSVTQDGITVSFAKGSGGTAPTWYAAGLRLYASNTVTVSSSNNITSVVFHWEKQGNKAFAAVTANVGSYTHPSAAGNGTWTGSAKTIVFTLGSSGQLQLNTMSATASGGGTDPVAVTGVSLNKNSTSIKVGATETLTATVSPNDATVKSVTWKSYSDSACTTESSAVASVSSTGEVTGVSQGTAYIQVKTTDGNFTAKCTVTVTPPTDTYNLGGKTWFIKAGSYIANTITDSSSHAPATSEKSSAQAFEFIIVGDNQFNIKAVGGDYDGKYLYSTSSTGSSNKCYLNTTIQKWTVVTNSTNINLKDANNNYLCCYSSSDFRAYGNLNNGNPNFTFESASFTVTYDGNTNSSGTAPTDSTSYASGATVTVKGNTGNLAKTGYSFGGWNTNAQGTGTTYDGGATFSISGDTTLYAKWTANSYNINYYDQGGSAFSGTHATGYPTQHTYGTATTLKTATKTGYTFGGWFTTSACTGSAVNSLGATAYTAAIDLFAKWTAEQYSVSASITNGGFTGTTGANAATFGVEYTATITANANYALPASLTVTMGGAATNAYSYNSSTGAFSIASPTGNISISGVCTPDSTEYLISTSVNDGSYSGDTSIYSGFTASITFTPNDHFKLPADSSAFTVNHAEIQSYNSSTGVLVLENPDDDVTVSVSMVAKSRYDVNLNLTNITKSSGPSGTDAVEEGEEVTLVFAANSNYGLPSAINVVMGETTLVVNQDYSWAQNSGTLHLSGLTADLSVSVSGVQRDLTNGSLTLGTKQTSYSLGDTFIKPSTITANFNIAPTMVDVKNDVVVTGPINDDLVVTGPGTITITYTFPATGSTQSASYAITATPITPVTGGYTEVTASKTDWSGTYVIVSDDYMLGNSISSSRVENADLPTISEGKITSTVTDAMKWTIAPVTGGYTIRNVGNSKYLSSTGANNKAALNDTATDKSTWTIAYSGGFTITNKSNSEASVNSILRQNGTYGWATYGGGTGNAPILYEYTAPVVAEIKWITAEVKSGTYYQGSSVTVSDFTVTAHYNDGDTSTLSSGVTVTNGYLANIGNNEVTLTYSGKSCKVNVTAVEQTATLTGLTWAQGELTIIDGHAIDFSTLGTVTATYDTSPSVHVGLDICTVSTYTKSNDTYTKVSDIDDGDTISSTSHGKYLGVSYTEKGVTKVAYSSAAIYVVESINSVRGKQEVWTYDLENSIATSLSDGDKVVMIASGWQYELSGVDSYGSGAAYEDSLAGSHALTVEHVSGNVYAFKDSENKYLRWQSGNTLNLSSANIDVTEDANSTWAVTFDGTVAHLVNQGTLDEDRTLSWNNSSPRFANYKDSTTTGQSASSYSYISFVKGAKVYVPSGDNIANTNAVVQKAVLEYAISFNTDMNCTSSGETANVASKWSQLSSDFDDLLDSFSGDNLTHFKALFAGADAVEGGDTLQDMLARYEYICRKYELDDFLAAEDVGRPPVAQSPHISPLINIVGEKANSVAIIVIISMVSVTAIGGYFFLRKRKDNY